MEKKELIRLILVSGSVILVDQISKELIMMSLALHQQVVVIENFFNLTHVLNPGGAFGFFASQSQAVLKIVFLVLPSVAVLFICWFYTRIARTHVFLSWSLALIFGGAMGNLIDRFRYGHVVDFFDFHVGSWHWPAFNVADSAIMAGMAILIYHMVCKKMPEI